MTKNFTDKQISAVEYLNELNIDKIDWDDKDVTIEKIKSKKKILKVELKDNHYIITISEDHLLFRGIYVLLPRLIRENKVKIEETTAMKDIAYSLDASRNGVMNLPTLKKFIAYLSIMGFTSIYLYTEDTYEVEGLPYFGYLRGKYKKSEIKEIVSFASLFDIEIIPSIQTLAHLTQYLKWPETTMVKDDENTLLIGEEQTYKTIEEMIASCKEMYNTKKIHLGMDEAYQAGLGRYIELYGYTDRAKLMIKHINSVLEIVKKYELKPIIWSDFIYKLLDTTNSSWLYNKDAVIDKDLAKNLPENLAYVHWDYGGEDVEQYEKVISKHLEFCEIDNYTFAGGAHIWGRLAPNHGKSINTINASLEACLNKGVKSVMLTTWGDDGQETEHWHSLISAIYYTECVYSEGTLSNVRHIFDTIFGKSTFEMMYELRKFDELDTVTNNNSNMTNISKQLLWQDLLVGVYEDHIKGYIEDSNKSLNKYYYELTDNINEINIYPNDSIFKIIKKRYSVLSKLLSIKSELGLKLIDARKSENIEMLKKISEIEIEKLILLFEQLKELHYLIWQYTYKSYGWEVLEQRYAHSVSRLKTSQRRINDYFDGKDNLEELLEPRLPYCKVKNPIEFNGFSYRYSAVTGYN